MRWVRRSELPHRIVLYLARRQAATDVGSVEQDWKSARQTATLKTVLRALQAMMGARERCMYCVDSHGSDIDHFWPKVRYPAKAFEWRNMMLCCTECGRLKGDRFPLKGGEPLLVDPTQEDPWLHIDFDPDTGNLTPRFDLASGASSEKGECTVAVLQLDRREGLAEGYRRSYARVVARVNAALEEADIDPERLARDVKLADDHGLSGWCFVGAGARQEPFRSLKEKSEAAWAACAAIGVPD